MKIKFGTIMDFGPNTKWQIIVDGLRVNSIDDIFSEEHVVNRAKAMGIDRNAKLVVIEHW